MALKSNIRRLLQYRICLQRFQKLGFTRIYSYNLGHEAGVSAEQVRKDFSIFGLKGNKKAGYYIPTLLKSLNDLFGMDEVNNVILVGMGNLGRALAIHNNQYIGSNVYIVAAFDKDPSKQNRKYGIPVFDLNQMSELIMGFKVQAAILTIPAAPAQEICNILVNNKIKAILNFTPMVLKAPDEVIIHNINLSTEIEALIYHLKNPDL